MAHQVSAIIPAHNEADLIGDTVRSVKAIPGVSQVIVVDDASSDDTAEVANAAGANEVIVLEHNLGKGGALNVGLGAVEEDYILLLDADLGSSAAEAEKLLEPVLSGEADMSIAIFGKSPELAASGQAARSGGFGFVVKTARFGIKLLGGQSMESPLSGQRAMRKEIAEKSGGFQTGFGVEVGLTIDALRMGYRVTEVPVEMVHRPSGRNLKGFIHRGKQWVDVLKVLARKVFQHRKPVAIPRELDESIAKRDGIGE